MSREDDNPNRVNLMGVACFYGPILTKGGGGWGGGVTTSLRWLPATAGQIFVTRCHEEKH